MDHVIYFKDLFEFLTDCRKIVLLMFLFKNDVDLLNECRFVKKNINRRCKEIKFILPEQKKE